MHKIYVNNVPIILTVHQTENFPNQCSKVLQLCYHNTNDLLDIIRYVESKRNEIEQVKIVGKDLQKLQNDFASIFKQIDAAGGIVFNEANEALLIFRNNKWDLPKGKVEKGEGIKDAAIREVTEETGVKQISIQAPILLPTNQNNVTYHTYYNNKRQRMLKSTYWYRMYCPEAENGTPQLEEGITKVAWIPKAELVKHRYRTFGSIRDVISASI